MVNTVTWIMGAILAAMAFFVGGGTWFQFGILAPAVVVGVFSGHYFSGVLFRRDVRMKGERQRMIYAAARRVVESRHYTEKFFRENPEETGLTERGKSVLHHHRKRYEAYLVALELHPDEKGTYPDAYWKQLENIERYGTKELPGLPLRNIHRYLALMK